MGINMDEPTQEGRAFEESMSLYDKDVKDNVPTNEWKKMDALTRGECYVEPPKPKAFERIDKINYYLDIAKAVSMRGTCLRRKFGAVIVKNDRIVSTGYVGAPKGRKNCSDLGTCFRMEHNIPSGTMYEKCRSVHAEMNAIISADKEELEGSVLFLCGIENDGSITENADCCAMCKRTIINAGISIVVVRTPDGYRPINVEEWIKNDDSLELHEGY